MMYLELDELLFEIIHVVWVVRRMIMYLVDDDRRRFRQSVTGADTRFKLGPEFGSAEHANPSKGPVLGRGAEIRAGAETIEVPQGIDPGQDDLIAERAE